MQSYEELINWINNLLKTNIVSIQQACNGAIACQILDASHPGNVPLHRLKLEVTQFQHLVSNYRVLQHAFIKQKIARKFNAETLIRSGPQENLEFLQWMRQYYIGHANTAVSYDPIERRKNPIATNAQSSKENSKKIVKKTFDNKENTMDEGNKVIICIKEITDLKNANAVLQREKDYYLNKLRDMEILLQIHEKEKLSLLDWTRKILYGCELANVPTNTIIPSQNECANHEINTKSEESESMQD